MVGKQAIRFGVLLTSRLPAYPPYDFIARLSTLLATLRMVGKQAIRFGVLLTSRLPAYPPYDFIARLSTLIPGKK